jgi:hypothetical protein
MALQGQENFFLQFHAQTVATEVDLVNTMAA